MLPQDLRGLAAARFSELSVIDEFVISPCSDLCKNGHFAGLCVDIMPRGKDISKGLREVAGTAHKSGKGYKTGAAT